MEKVTLDNLLTWKDIINLGDNGSLYPVIDKKLLRYCCENNYNKKLLEEDLEKYILEPLTKQIPGLIGDLHGFNFAFSIYEDEDGNIKTKQSFFNFLLSFVDKCFINIIPTKDSDTETYLFIDKNGNKEYINLHEYLYQHKNNLKEVIPELIRDQKKKIYDVIDYYGDNLAVVISQGDTKVRADKNYFLDMRKNINWLSKNYDKIEEYFNSEFPLEALEHVNKDRFIFSQAADSYENLCNFMISVENNDKEEIEAKSGRIYNSFRYVDNYFLMINYLRENGNTDYNPTMRYTFSGEEFSHSLKEVENGYKGIISELEKTEINLKEKFKFYDSYEDLLSGRLKDAWNKIQNERMVRNIKLSFEMISSGERITLKKGESNTKKYNRVTSNNETRQAKLKHDYDVIEEKMEYFESKKPLIQALGINEFKGYFANFYQNGTVVLDKYFKEVVGRRGKITTLPAVGEAIYVMDYKEFAELSLLKKMEIIREIVENDNKNVQRIYHTSNGSWKKKLDAIIDGYGYGGLDLGLLDMLVTGVSNDLDKQKQLIK